MTNQDPLPEWWWFGTWLKVPGWSGRAIRLTAPLWIGPVMAVYAVAVVTLALTAAVYLVACLVWTGEWPK